MSNLLHKDHAHLQSSYQLAGRSFKHILSRIDALLMVLKSCYGKECHEPWNTLHGSSKVKNLRQALDSEYDAFYDDQPRVSFSSCEMGYLKAAEGPQHVNKWDDERHGAAPADVDGKQQSFQYTGPIEWWT